MPIPPYDRRLRVAQDVLDSVDTYFGGEVQPHWGKLPSRSDTVADNELMTLRLTRANQQRRANGTFDWNYVISYPHQRYAKHLYFSKLVNLKPKTPDAALRAALALTVAIERYFVPQGLASVSLAPDPNRTEVKSLEALMTAALELLAVDHVNKDFRLQIDLNSDSTVRVHYRINEHIRYYVKDSNDLGS